MVALHYCRCSTATVVITVLVTDVSNRVALLSCQCSTATVVIAKLLNIRYDQNSCNSVMLTQQLLSFQCYRTVDMTNMVALLSCRRSTATVVITVLVTDMANKVALLSCGHSTATVVITVL